MKDGATTACTDEKSEASSPLDKVRALLAEGNADEVIALVAELVANNGALRRRLEELSRKRFKTSETMNSAQLRLLLSELSQPEQDVEADELKGADAALVDKADLDALKDEDEKKKKKGKKRTKHAARRPFPDKLRRVAQMLVVPDDERPCPKCGGQRVCIGHDVTEVLDRIPAEIIVVQNKREKLACKNSDCEGSLCRAPGPDNVVAGGRFGPRLVSSIIVDKYRDGCVPRRQTQQPRGRRRKLCCVDDEGWPLGIGVQARVPNRLELRGSRARVVSVEGKGAARLRQVRSMKTSASEPLMTCRKVGNIVETGWDRWPGMSPESACLLAGRRSA